MIAVMITIFYICIGTVRVNEDEHDDDIAVNCLLIMEIFAQITLHGAASARAVHSLHTSSCYSSVCLLLG